jgi:two-component system OmpR family response regulator
MLKSCRTLLVFINLKMLILYLAVKLSFFSPVISYREIFNPGPALMEKDGQNKPQALIIDDETDICYLLKGILRHKNIEADHATSLAEGEQLLQQYKYNPAVIFLDNYLPDGLGIDHIRHIKREYPFSKIVMITAHDSSADREKAYNEGVDFFIGKPFTRDIIFKTLEKIAND